MLKNQSNKDIKGVRLVLVDDNLSLRMTLRQLLKDQFGCKIVAEVLSGEELLSNKHLSFDEIIIMNIGKLKLNEINIAQKINWMNPKVKIIAITSDEKIFYLRDLIEIGFKGCVLKSRLYNTIVEAISAVRDNHYYFPDDLDFK